MNELIEIKQLPIITERFKEVSELAQAKITEVLALGCTDENIQTVKKFRTELRKDFDIYEERRKHVNKTIEEKLKPFTDAYKTHITDVYKPADAELKARIDALENEKKEKTRKEVEAYFNEYLQSKGIDFVSFERSGIVVTLSTTVAKLKKQSKEYIDKIVDDLALIDTQEHKAEILVEYKKTLNVSAAITSVSERMKAIEAERTKAEEAKRLAEERAAAVAKIEERVESESPAPLVAPIAEPESGTAEPARMITVSFKVTDTKERLLALRQHMKKEGYNYE